jgi:HEAT repeat protein
VETFQQRLDQLIAAESAPNRVQLKLLANLGPHHMYQLAERWLRFEAGRRRQIIDLALETAEEQVDLDFRPLFQVALNDPEGELRAAAIGGLWEDERPAVQRQLQRMLNDDSGSVRVAAALGLARFARRAAIGELSSADAESLLAALLKHCRDEAQPLDVRRRCIEALGYFTDSDAAIDLVTRAYADEEIVMRESAVLAMGRSMREEFYPNIRRELQSRSPALRYEAARAVGELGEDGAALLSDLLPLCEDDDTEIALTAIWSLGQVGGAAARRVLTRLSRSSNEAHAQAAQDALSELEIDSF